jgi:hypothetical protein
MVGRPGRAAERGMHVVDSIGASCGLQARSKSKLSPSPRPPGAASAAHAPCSHLAASAARSTVCLSRAGRAVVESLRQLASVVQLSPCMLSRSRSLGVGRGGNFLLSWYVRWAAGKRWQC